MSGPQTQSVIAAEIEMMAATNGEAATTVQCPHVVIDLNTRTLTKTPSLHLLEANNREKYLNLCVPLFKAALKGDWEAAKIMLDDPKQKDLLTASITKGFETILHIAARARQIHFVKEVVKRMSEQDLELQDNKGNTAFSVSAAAGTLEIAKIMIQKNSRLPTIRGAQGMTPLYMATLLRRSEMAWYLYRKTHEMLDERDRCALFFSCIDNGLYDLAIKILHKDPALATARNMNDQTALHVLARMPSEFVNQSPGMWSTLINVSCFEFATKKKRKQMEAIQLVEDLWKHILNHGHDEVMNLIRYPSELLFDATRLGNFEFLVQLIRAYPELLWETNDKNHSLLHVAVLNRHANIFNLVHELGSIKDLIATYHDVKGNNILHLAAKLAPENQLNLVSGAALQMQRELIWFEEVKKIVQPPAVEMKNKENRTPGEVYTHEHKDLLRKGESWMKSTANSCMIVSTLIATVVFAAAFTVPGGTSNSTGTPNFLKETAFLFFAISDGVAFVSSSTSILMFLYILTSRYAENDFLTSLPLKLMVGLTSLFVSIATMMIAFSTAFYLSCHDGLRWLADLIFLFSFVPVLLFIFLQYPLLADMFYSTYYSSLLFQPKKYIID